MSLVVSAVTGSANSTSVTTSSSITIASGDSLSVGVITAANGTTVSSVTFNTGSPQSATLVSAVPVSTTMRLEVWEITAPSAGTATVTAAVSLTGQCCIIAARVQGAASGASYRDAVQTNSGTASSAPNVTIASAVNDLALAFIGNKNTNSTWTPDGSPVTQVVTPITSGTGTSHVRLALLAETGAASTSPSGAYGASRDWAAIGFNLNIAGSSVAALEGNSLGGGFQTLSGGVQS